MTCSKMLCKNQIELLAVLKAIDTYNPYNLAVPKQYQNIGIYYITNDSTYLRHFNLSPVKKTMRHVSGS